MPTCLPLQLPVYNEHRSDAESLVNAQPVILVQGIKALCDGGGGATGHPVEYIKLDKREGASPTPCKYCGLRFQMAPGARECRRWALWLCAHMMPCSLPHPLHTPFTLSPTLSPLCGAPPDHH